MSNSAIFLGKFDDNFLELEKYVINMGENASQSSSYDEIIKDYDQFIKDHNPDVKKYTNHNIDFWTILGDVKPTLLLKNLISDARLVFFVFNLESEIALDFLTEGWEPIANKVAKSDKQKRILIGTNTESNNYDDEITQKILNAMEKLKCDAYYDKNQNNRIKTEIESKFITNLIDYIKKEISNEPIQSQPSQNKEINKKAKPKKKEETSKKKPKRIKITKIKRKTYINTDLLRDEDDDLDVNKEEEKNEELYINDELTKEEEEEDKNGELYINDELTKEEEEEDKNEELYINDELTKEEEKEQKQENEEFKTIRESDGFVYHFMMKTQTAELFQAETAQNKVEIPIFLHIDDFKYIITKICDCAFENSRITSLTFQKDSQIRQIGNFAFKNSQIQEIFIPASLERLEKYWCGGATNLSEIEVDSNNQHFYIENDFLIHNIEPVPEILFVSRYSYIGTLKVSMNIGSYAFYQYTKIRSLVSETDLQVLKIGDFSFFGSSLTNIKFKNEEIHLGDHCFSESTKLQSVDITVTRKLNFGSNSFSNCSSLTTISLLSESEENLIIPSDTFQNCKSLKELKIETKSTLIINNETFSTIRSLETVELISNKIKLCEKCFYNSFNSNNYSSDRQPNIIKISSESEIEIENNCFEESNLEKLEINGRRIIMSKKSFMNCLSLTTISVGSESKEDLIIPSDTFQNCKSLKEIKIETKSTLIINNETFSSIGSLETVELIANKIKLCEKCFYNSFNSKSNSYNQRPNLIKISSESEIEIENNCFEESNLNKVEMNGRRIIMSKEIFKNCSSLTTISLVSESKEDLIIPSDTFRNCKSIKEIKIETKSTLIIDNETFSSIRSLETVELISNKIKLCEKCFYNSFNSNKYGYYRQLNHIKISSESEIEIENNCFERSNLVQAEIKGRRIILKKESFKNCSSLQSITISQSPEIIIDELTFNNCSKLNTFKLNQVGHIEFKSQVFAGCNQFKSISISKLPKFNSLDYFEIKTHSQKIKTGKSFTILNKMTKEKYQAKILNDKLKEHESKSIDIETIILISKENNPTNSSNFGICFLSYCEKQYLTILTNYYDEIKDEHIKREEEEEEEENKNEEEQKQENEQFRTIEDSNIFVYNLIMTTKAAELLKAEKAQYEVKIPNFVCRDKIKYKITKICDYAFENSKITTLTFQKDSKIRQIGNFAFQNSGIQKIFIPASLERLDKYWCGGATNLSKIEVDSNNQHFYIEKGFLIHNIEPVPEILFPSRYSYIDTLKISMNIGSYAFYHNTDIQSLFSETDLQVLKIGDFSFHCSNLTNIEFKNEEIHFGDHCFSKSTKLQSVEITATRKLNFGSNLFSNCSSLTTISLVNESKENLIIPSDTFQNCKSIKELKIETKSTLIINNETFSSIRSLETVELIANTIKLCEKCFYNSFKSRNRNNRNLNNISILSKSDIEIEDNCFEESNIEKVEINGGRIIMTKKSFMNCSSLTAIILKNKNKEDLIIPSDTFQNCKLIRELKIQTESTLIINNETFSSIGSLENVELISNKIKLCERCFYNSFNSKSNSSNQQPNLIKISSESEIEIENNCFEESNLDQVEINGGRIIMSKEIFKNCSSLTTISLVSESKEDLIIPFDTFQNCKSLKELKIQTKSTLIINNETFSSIRSFKNVELISNKIKLCERCFYNSFNSDFNSYNRHSNLIIISSESEIEIENNCFEESNLEKVEMNGRRIILKKESFKNCSSFLSITFSQSPEIIIEELTFNNCSKLNTFKLNQVGYIEFKSQAFSGCNQLKSISISKLPEYNSFNSFEIKVHPQQIKTDESFTILNKTTKEKYQAKILNDRLENQELIFIRSIILILKENKPTISSNFGICFLSYCEKQYLTILTNYYDEIKYEHIKREEEEEEEENKNEEEQKQENEQFRTIEDSNVFVYNIIMTTKTAELFKAEKVQYEVKNGVEIPNFVCRDKIKYKITKICDHAFENSKITTLTFQKDSKIRQIGNFAFKNSQIQKIFIPASLERLDKYWCGGATNLSEIEVDRKNEHFYSSNGFLIYSHEQKPKILFAPRHLSDKTFKISMSVGSYAFSQNTGIRSLVSKTDLQVLEIDDFSFFGSSLTNIKFKNEEIHLDDHCFSESTKLRSVEIAATRKLKTGQYSFSNCSSLTTISLLSESKEDLIIPSNTFQNCKSLKELKIQTKSTLTINNATFSSIRSLETVELISNKIKLCEKCFVNSFNSKNNIYDYNYIRNLNFIRISSESDIEIENNCFERSNLGSVEINGGRITLKKESFKNCSSLQSITFSQSSKMIIEELTFNNCSNLNAFKLKQVGYAEFKSQVFAGCNQLKSISISKLPKYNSLDYFEINKYPQRYYKSFLVTNKMTNKKFIAKIIDEYQSISIEKIIILSKENNPTISTKFGICYFSYSRNQYLTILTKYYKNGSLEDSIQNRSLSNSQKYNILIGLILGLKYLETINIKQLNLTPHLIFLDESFHPHLNEIIFSKSTKLTIYDPPEIKYGIFMSFKSHVYSYSVIMYELITNDILNNNKPNFNLIENTNIQIFTKKCMSHSSTDRPTFEEILFEITKEQFINLFETNEEEIHKYFGLLGNTDITDKIEIENISYIIFKPNKTAIIIGSEQIIDNLKIPEYIEYQSKRYNITKIGNKSFSKSSIKTISFPQYSYISHIGEYAFSDSKLTKIIFPQSVEIIGKNSFINSKIKTIIIQSNKIQIKESCFENCKSLESIEFKNSDFIYLGPNSFKGCENLNQISIPKTKTTDIELQESCFSSLKSLCSIDFICKNLTIRKNCFENCVSLTTFSCQSSTITLFSEVFKGCKELNKISISKTSITDIKDNFFSLNNNIQSIEIDSKAISLNDNLFGSCKILQFLTIETEDKVTIKSNVFMGCDNLTKIVIATKNELTLMNEVFSGLNNIEIIYLTANEVKIGEKCFNKSFKIKKDNKNVIKISSESDVEIENNCFEESNIGNVEINGRQITLKKEIFKNCSSLQSITISQSSKIIIDELTFNNCSKLNTFKLDQVGYIEFKSQVFLGCNQLKSISISKLPKYNSLHYFEIKAYPQNIKTNESFTILNKTTKEKFQAKILNEHESISIEKIILISKENNPTISTKFGICYFSYSGNQYLTILTKYYENGSLEDLIQNRSLSNSQKYNILIGLTLGLKYLETINIKQLNLTPELIFLDESFHPHLNEIIFSKPSRRTIYNSLEMKQGKHFTFKSYVYIYSLIIYELITGIPISQIENEIMNNNQPNIKQIENIEIQQFFEKCMSPTLDIRPTFEEISYEVTKEQFINLFKDNEEEEIYKYFILWGKTDITGIIEIENISYIIFKPNKTAIIIGSEQIIDNLKIPEYIEYQSKRYNITKIGNKSFSKSSIKTISFPQYSYISHIGEYAFSDSKLTKIIFPQSVEIIGKNSFINSKIKTIIIQSNKIQIKESCFENCKSLESIEFQNSKSIIVESNSFCGCGKLYQILIPKTKTTDIELHKSCFANLKSLCSIEFICNNLILGDNCFENCVSLTTFSCQSSAITLFSEVFKGCKKLQIISISKTEITDIKDNFFSLYNNIQSIKIESSSINLNNNKFSKCKSLESIDFRNCENIIIGPQSFNGCDKLKQVNVSLTKNATIKSSCFSYLQSLQKVDISSEEIYIYDYCFRGCINLSSISLQESKIINLDAYAFLNCQILKSVQIKSTNQIKIGSHCFNNAKNLSSITFDSKEINISDHCFYNCSNLSSIFFLNAINIKIDSNLFNNYNKLSKLYISSKSKIDLSNKCFDNLTNLQEITLSSEEINIGESCFNNCSDLFTISFYNVKNAKLGSCAFSDCNRLSKFEISASSKLEICQRCFQGAKFLNTVKLTGGNVIIGNWAFIRCNLIKSVFIKSNENHSISDCAFFGLENSQIERIYEGKKQK